jgi:hypothetical protein
MWIGSDPVSPSSARAGRARGTGCEFAPRGTARGLRACADALSSPRQHRGRSSLKTAPEVEGRDSAPYCSRALLQANGLKNGSLAVKLDMSCIFSLNGLRVCRRPVLP